MRDFLLICLLFVAEFALALIFVTPDYAVRQSVKEAQWIEMFLGAESAEKLQARADATYQALILDTGADRKIGRIVPNEEERANSKGLEHLGETLWPHIEERIAALLDLFYWFIRRLHLLLMWLPACIPALAASAISGLLTRRIKQTNFQMTSAVMQHYTWRICGWATALFLLAFFAPIAIPPVVVPVIICALAVAFGLSLGNIAKRI